MVAVPCSGAEATARPVNWGRGTVSAEKLLDGVKTVILSNSDYFFDGGSLIYQAQTGEEGELYIGLPHPSAVLHPARRKDHQYVLISHRKDFDKYAVVEEGSEAEKKLVDLLRGFAEKWEVAETRPRAPHGQDLVEAAQFIALTIQTREQPDTWGAKALGMRDSLFP